MPLQRRRPSSPRPLAAAAAAPPGCRAAPTVPRLQTGPHPAAPRLSRGSSCCASPSAAATTTAARRSALAASACCSRRRPAREEDRRAACERARRAGAPRLGSLQRPEQRDGASCSDPTIASTWGRAGRRRPPRGAAARATGAARRALVAATHCMFAEWVGAGAISARRGARGHQRCWGPPVHAQHETNLAARSAWGAIPQTGALAAVQYCQGNGQAQRRALGGRGQAPLTGAGADRAAWAPPAVSTLCWPSTPRWSPFYEQYHLAPHSVRHPPGLPRNPPRAALRHRLFRRRATADSVTELTKLNARGG